MLANTDQTNESQVQTKKPDPLMALSPSDRKFLRRMHLISAFGQAAKTDIEKNPWKLFPLLFPAGPPLTGVLTIFLTALHFAAGLTKHAREQRSNIMRSYRDPINFEDYEDFIVNKADKGAQEELCVDRKKMKSHAYHVSKRELWDLGHNYAQKLSPYFNQRVGEATLRYLERKRVQSEALVRDNLDRCYITEAKAPKPSKMLNDPKKSSVWNLTRFVPRFKTPSKASL